MPIAFVTEFSLEQQPAVPHRLRMKVGEALREARAVSICEKGPNRKQNQINKFALTEGDSPLPKESTEEIAQAIADVMQHHALIAEEELEVEDIAEGSEFLIRFHLFTGGGRNKTFGWSWRIDRFEDDLDDDQFDLSNPDLDEGSHVYLHACIKQLTDFNERTMLAKERSDNRLLEMAERTQKPMEHATTMQQFSHQTLMQAMQMMVGTLQTQYSHEEAKVAEEAKSDRMERILKTVAETVGPAAKVGFQQAMLHWGAKLRGVKQRTPRAAEFSPDGTPPPTPSAAPRPRSAPPPTPAEPESETDVLFEMVAAFAESLKPAQRKILRSVFTPEALDLFDDLLESKDGTEVTKRYGLLSLSLGGDLGPLMEVVGQLEDDQQRLAITMISMISDAEPEPEPEPTTAPPKPRRPRKPPKPKPSREK